MATTPSLTVADVQAKREDLAARLRVAREEHVRLAYLAATEDGYQEASRDAKLQVDNLEAAMQHLSTLQVGALEAAARADALAARQRWDELIEEADDAAGKAMVLADRLDAAIDALASTWVDFERQWDAHAGAVFTLSNGLPDTRLSAVMDATQRSNVMREHISTLLFRRGLSLPDGEDTGAMSDSQPFVAGVQAKLIHARRASQQLPVDFPGRGKYDAPRVENGAAS